MKHHLSAIGEIAAAAALTHGAIDDSTLDAIGISRRHRQELARRGVLRRFARGAYLVGPVATNPTPDSLRAIGMFVAGPSGAISHVTAAVAMGIWDRSPADIVHLTAPRRIHDLRDRRFTCHEVDDPFDATDTCLVRNVRMTAVAMTCFMLGSMLTPFELAAVLRRASDRGLLHLPQLESIIDDRPGHRGVAVARAAVALHYSCSGGTRSASEDCYLARAARLGLPLPVVNTKGAATVPGYEPDIVYEPWRTIVHLDGAGHDRPGVAEQDELEDERLRDDGWSIVRGSSSEPWRRDDRMIHRVRRTLESRGWNGLDGVPPLDDPTQRALIAWLHRPR